ncbi:NifU family protein [Amycolatopsis sp. NPDC059657]|uniref:NifU family protein n=1 Tax=Amycolatopsis sp. NPDC059657 TaxID=3346899 RepID=UPI00366DCA8E
MTRPVGERIEELLAGLRSGPARDQAEEIVRLLMGLYGDGLRRFLSILREHDPSLIGVAAEDKLLEDLLLLHDLHPLDADSRVRRVVERVGGFGYDGIDPDGVVRLRIDLDGCPATTVPVQKQLEAAILEAAPEVTAVEFTGRPAALLQIGMGPPS